MKNQDIIVTQHLTINGKVFSFLEVQSQLIQTEDEYTNEVLSFCFDWLNNRQEFVLHTSGSTGLPKPISIKRKQMEASASMTAKALGLKKGMRAFCCLNTNYVAGKMMLVRAMEVGMSIEVVKPSSIPFAEDTQPFDFIALVPLQVEAIIKSEYFELLNKAKTIIVGGAPISFSLSEAIKEKLLPEVFHTYGMTETVSHIALKNVKKSEVYDVLDGVRVSLTNDDCLEVESILTDGRKIVTTDLVEMISENQFKWLGRSDFVINSGGVKIHPSLLEQKIQELFYKQGVSVSSFFITGMHDKRLGEKVVMFIEGGIIDLTSVVKFLKLFEKPKEVFFVDQFEYTKTGKVDRKKTLMLLGRIL